MILYISNELIKRHSTKDAYKKGVYYYDYGCITDFNIDHINSIISARLNIEKIYDVKITYSMENKQIKCACSCHGNSKRSSLCEHTVATLMETAKRDINGDFEKTPFARADEVMMSLFENTYNYENIPEDNPQTKAYLIQTIKLGLKSDYDIQPHKYEMSAEITFKSGGPVHRYQVRNLRGFVNSICENQEVELGKKFKYTPGIHRFTKDSLDILEFLYYTLTHNNIKVYNDNCLISGKKLFLSGVLLEKYLELCSMSIDDVEFIKRSGEKVTFLYYSKPSFDFYVDEIKSNVILDIKVDDDLLVSQNAKYILMGNKLFRTDMQTSHYTKSVLETIIYKDTKKIMFPGEYAGKFYQQILPKLNTLGRVNMDEQLQQKVISEKPKIICKFDKYRNNILLYPEIKYQDIVINAANDQPTEGDPLKYVIRDLNRESKLKSLILATGFYKDDDHYTMNTNDKIYDFLRDYLPKYQEEGEVYYSEEFKKIHSVKTPALFLNMGIVDNWLDINFSIEQISDEDLFRLLNSIRQKKKYYRLKNGEFFDLEFDDAEKWAEMLDRLDVERNDIHNGSVHLPVYRALYMDELMQDRNMSRYIVGSESFSNMINKVKNYDKGELTVPDPLKGVLRNYQITGYKQLRLMTYCGLGVILADDMGLGKTLQILTLLLSNKLNAAITGEKIQPSLIIVPTSLVYNWMAEIEKFTPELKVQPLIGTPVQRQDILSDLSGYDILLTTYGIIRRDTDLYNTIEFEYCILDESQHIKNPLSIGAKGVKLINAKKKIAMTGTPIENNVIELWSVFDFLMPGFFGSLNKFNKKFGKNTIDDMNSAHILRKMTSPFIIRRLKSDVLGELPDKIITKMNCDLTKEQKELYMAYLAEAKKEINIIMNDRDLNRKRFTILSSLLRLRQICCHPGMFVDSYKGGSGKTELFLELVEEAVQSGHRILVFSQFTAMLSILAKELEIKGYTYFYLDGSVPSEDRIESVNKFNQGERPLFLISLKAGGFGLNLTGADVVIHYDPWWNPAVEDQATDRAHRIGQDKKVQVIRLVTKGTIEDKILYLQEKKKNLIDNVIHANQEFPEHIDTDEIIKLLQE